MKELSGRSRQTVQQAMALLANMLQPEVSALLDRLQSSTRPARDCCLESLNALRMRRADFFPAMVELLDRGCAQAMLGARLPPRPSLVAALPATSRSDAHTSELQSLM